MVSVAASAQGYRRLHINALSMRTDHRSVQVGQVFHVAIHVHVTETVTNLDELVVPDVGTLEPMGDERAVSHANGGTDVVETLTLAAAQPGVVTLRPAYLDAIEPRSGKALRFSSNPLRIVVLAARAPDLGDPLPGIEHAFLVLVAVVAGVVVVLIAAVVVVRLVHGRRRAAVVIAAPVPVAPPPPPAPTRSPREDVEAALRRYRTAPANGALRVLRAALFVAAGAAPGGTLRDALDETSNGALRRALTAAEGAAFGPEAMRDAASTDLIAATERWLA
jgi:hypothetical protein